MTDRTGKHLKDQAAEELAPLIAELAKIRHDAYKRGFWYGLIVASTLFLAASIARVIFGL